MLSKASTLSESSPGWLFELLKTPTVEENKVVVINGQNFVMQDGLLRSQVLVSVAQKQTEETFGYKWKKRNTFESDAMLGRMREWLIEKYGDITIEQWLNEPDRKPVLLDAGCGASMSALELFGRFLGNVRYLGVDVSEAVDIARDRFRERGLDAAFMQASILNLPIPDNSVDVIFSEGVLHHTDSTEHAIKYLAKKIRPGGHFMFYVYKKKGPVREFTDDYVREKMQSMSGEEGWEAMMPLTKLGKLLGDMNIEVDVPENIDLLEIPAGKMNLQRLFYWHVFKAFHHPDLTLDEMNHINYDWYAPANAHRQTPQQVREWCGDAGLVVEREVIEDAGITIIARKQT